MTELLAVILGVLIRLIVDYMNRPAQQAQILPRNVELRTQLREKLRRNLAASMNLLLAALLVGCTHTRTVYIPPGEPVQLRETIHGAKVWVVNPDGQRVATTVDLPEGWYCLPAD